MPFVHKGYSEHLHMQTDVLSKLPPTRMDLETVDISMPHKKILIKMNSFNISKTKFFVIISKEKGRRHNLMINSTPTGRVLQFAHLGVMINEDSKVTCMVRENSRT